MSNKSSVAQMQREPSASRWAKTPFYFNSAEHLLRIERERANTLGELLGAIKTCTDASIFQHTFRTLQEHHFIQEGYSNDFSMWLEEQMGLKRTAELINRIDIYTSTLQGVRNRIVRIVETALA